MLFVINLLLGLVGVTIFAAVETPVFAVSHADSRPLFILAIVFACDRCTLCPVAPPQS